MKTVNLGNSFTRRLSLRLNDEQFNFLCDVSKLLCVSPSEFVRSEINLCMVTNRERVKEDLIRDGLAK